MLGNHFQALRPWQQRHHGVRWPSAAQVPGFWKCSSAVRLKLSGTVSVKRQCIAAVLRFRTCVLRSSVVLIGTCESRRTHQEYGRKTNDTAELVSDYTSHEFAGLVCCRMNSCAVNIWCENHSVTKHLAYSCPRDAVLANDPVSVRLTSLYCIETAERIWLVLA